MIFILLIMVFMIAIATSIYAWYPNTDSSAIINRPCNCGSNSIVISGVTKDGNGIACSGSTCSIKTKTDEDEHIENKFQNMLGIM